MHRPLLCLLLFVAAPLVRAETPFRFESTPGKLPKDIVPVQYNLHLSPDIEKRTFTGTETVDIEVRQATNRCVLNAANLEVQTANLALHNTPDLSPTIALDAATRKKIHMLSCAAPLSLLCILCMEKMRDQA